MQVHPKELGSLTEGQTVLLSEISFSVNPGELLTVVGPVGSGKTMLLLGLLNELELVSGEATCGGTVGYCPDSAWIIPSTVKENIVMDRPFNEDLYELALQCSSLYRDLEQMEFGDDTQIGDKGVTLSGGQKARICFARAVYADSDILLVDDPLSAVDAEVVQEMIESLCRLRDLGKCIILTTHQVNTLKYADKVLVLDNCSSVFYGTYEELVQREELQEFIGHTHIAAKEEPAKGEPKAKRADTMRRSTTQRLIEAEERAKGSIPLRMYWKYLMLGYKNPFIFTGCLILLLLSQCVVQGVYYYVALLSGAEDQDSDRYVVLGVVLLIVCYLFNVFRFAVLYIGVLSANKHIHNLAIKSIAQTNPVFFDKNPTGRILNRFTKDVLITDEPLLNYIVECAHVSCMLLGNFIVMTIVSPLALIAIVFLVVLLVMAMKYVVPPSKELRKLDLISRSPLLTSIGAIASGIVSIRSLGLQQKFLETAHKAVHENMQCNMNYLVLLRYLQFLSDCGAYIIGGLNVISLIALKGSVSPEVAAMTLALIIANGGLSNFWSKTAVEMDNNMASVQRLFEYERLRNEGAYTRPVPFNITKGRIEFDDVSMKYQPHMPLALSNFSLVIEARSKVGVVGRTGAGKSSVLQVLFRLVNPCEGTVYIDGVDYLEVGLHQLRSQMSVIPQFPFLFKGTVRENLDPLHQSTTEEIERVIKQTSLDKVIERGKAGLDTQIQSGELNLSAGQKQLICLARAILRKNKIVMMDEATANVDHETDKKMQQEIRNSFSDSTVIVIAHRLRTIIDSDMIVVFDEGRCVEVGSPQDLAFAPESRFRQLIDHTGADEVKYLLQRVEERASHQ